jgi:hypothetical protein
MTNAESVMTNAESVMTNAESVMTNAESVMTNAESVTTNAESVMTNAESVMTNVESVTTNAESVTTNAASVMTKTAFFSLLLQKTNTADMKQTLFSRMDVFFDRRFKPLLVVLIIMNLLLTFLFFDPKVSLSGDDADYVLYAYGFAENFAWPGFRGALYPIFLSPFIALFGIRLVLLKSLSALCIAAMLWCLYRAFYRRIPASILFFTLSLVSVNGYLLFYESQTFSEPLFMLVQTALILFFIKYFIAPPDALPCSKSSQVKSYLMVAFLALLLTLTRTVGYVGIVVVAGYFLLHKQWKKSLYAVLAAVICFGGFHLIKQLLWPGSGSSYSLEAYLVKDMYNPTKGMETIGGFVTRFVLNAEGYLSRDLAKFMGLRGEGIATGDLSALLTVVFAALLLAALRVVWKKNKPLLFASLYALALCGAHFVLLQAIWQQERFMLVLYPVVLLLLLGGLYYVLEPRRRWQFVLPLCAIILLGGTLSHTLVKLERHLPVLQRNLRNDPLYGYTPDWRNFMLMSQWAATHVPRSAVIASRKPSISCIHGNRDFVGIYSVPAVDNSVLSAFTPPSPARLLLVDIAPGTFPDLAPFMRYVAFGKQDLNGKETPVLAVYEIDAAEMPHLLPALEESEVNFSLDYKPVFAHIAAHPDILCYSPDSLYQDLRNRNIRYMIMASLRINPAQNTGSIINTLHRYMSIVRLKYPYIVKQELHTIGATEPATLLELQY